MTKPYLVFCILLAGSALAEDAQMLARDEVKAVAEGHQWIQRLSSDGSIVSWDMRSNGNLFAIYKGGGTRNQMATFVEHGVWAINDLGQLCVEFRGSKWPSPDQCMSVGRKGDGYRLFLSTSPSQVYAEMTVE